MNFPTPIVNAAGERFLARLSQNDPQLYSAVVARMPNGMGAMGDFWGNISDAFSGVIKAAPQIMQSELEAKRRMEAAEKMAEEELQRARLQIQQQEVAARALRSQREVIQAQQMLEQEKANLAAAEKSILSAGQKMGLGVAAILGFVLMVMVSNRKKRGG